MCIYIFIYIYKTAKFQGTRVELNSSDKISIGFTKARPSREAIQIDGGEEASPPSSPTAASESQSCVACAGLIPRDWALRVQHCRSYWPTKQQEACTWEKTK